MRINGAQVQVWRARGIYGLVDPREPDLVRYVGMAERFLDRFLAHLREAKGDRYSRRGEWITGLQKSGLLPDMVVLEVVQCHRQRYLEGRERYWITKYVLAGQADLNQAVPAGVRGIWPTTAAENPLEPPQGNPRP